MSEAEYHSIKETYKFLCQLIDPKRTPRVAKPIREKARACLKNFPAEKYWSQITETAAFFNPR